MTFLFYLFVTLCVYIFMECMTWIIHKYVMHGFMWYFHADHHQPGYENFFERNDVFFLIFSTPSITLFYFGSENNFNYLFFIGLGIFLYGMSYFIVHEIIIHRRFKWLDNIENRYFRALRKAHKIHHKHLGKEDGECFGMLFVPLKYFKETGFIK